MTIKHELYYFHTAAFCQLINDIVDEYGIEHVEHSMKSTACGLCHRPFILKVLDQCGGWNPQTLADDIDSDLTLAIFCLVLSYSEPVAQTYHSNHSHHFKRKLADVCREHLDPRVTRLLENWRPPATSSDAYIVDETDRLVTEAATANLSSNPIMRSHHLLHIAYG